MGVSSYPIQVLAEMVEEFDLKQPKPGRATTAFIKRWRAKELEEKHSSDHHLQAAVRCINPAEIQNIRETKHFRDEQRTRKLMKRARTKRAAEERAAKKIVADPPRRNVIW